MVLGMPEETGPQAESGLLPAEAGPEDHQIPAAPQGETPGSHAWPGIPESPPPPYPQRGHIPLTATLPSQPHTHPAEAAPWSLNDAVSEPPSSHLL